MALLHMQTLRTLSTTSVGSQVALTQCYRSYSSRSYGDFDDKEFAVARAWHSTFRLSSIPVSISETSFSRASGPGGQKTNKTSSKATTIWPLHNLLPLLPKVLHQDIKDCRFYVKSSDTITIQSDTHRNQSGNRDETFQKLYDEIQSLYRQRVPGITPPEQKKRIESFLRKVRFRQTSLGVGGMKPYVAKHRLDYKAMEKIKRQVVKDKKTKMHIKDIMANEERLEKAESKKDTKDGQGRKKKKADNTARLKMKKMHGDKKRARSGGGRNSD